jgi:hypothetical protein
MADMDERSAMAVVAVRALEEADRARTSWTDDDRAWASRAAAQVVGEHAAPQVFIARRAALALERMATRASMLPRMARAWRWRPWVGAAIVAAALLAGLVVDRIDGTQRINVMAPPVLLLVLWNLAVYAVLGAGFVLRYGEASAVGPLRRAVVRLATIRFPARAPRDDSDDPVPRALAALARDWIALSAPLYAMRAARILHLAAAALAIGVVAGLYWRGLAVEYRATWESTFLQPPFVRGVLAALYAPGAWLTGGTIPDVAAIAAMRAPGSASAAPWLHLMAATIALVVIVPRLVLALGAGGVERHRAARLPVVLDDAYSLRLLRGLHDGPLPVLVVPYSFTPDPSAAATLAAILGRAAGGNASVTLAPVVAYGADEVTALVATPPAWPVLLFNLAATPEVETHGVFLAAMAAQATAGEPLLVVVDEAGFRARMGDDPARLEARRALWRRLCDDHQCAALFVDLSAPDFAAAERALDAALAQAPGTTP